MPFFGTPATSLIGIGNLLLYEPLYNSIPLTFTSIFFQTELNGVEEKNGNMSEVWTRECLPSYRRQCARAISQCGAYCRHIWEQDVCIWDVCALRHQGKPCQGTGHELPAHEPCMTCQRANSPLYLADVHVLSFPVNFLLFFLIHLFSFFFDHFYCYLIASRISS